MLIVKLIVILIFLLVSSKSLAVYVNKKTELSHEISLGLGYLLNIALFFICTFIPMFFRLSYFYMMIGGTIYTVICLYSIYKAFKSKQLFKFTRREIISLIIAIVFTILFGMYIDFGYAEMYDSYFYSIYSNSGTSADKLSIINPYNGIADMQNYYKYISFYLEPSFFANIFNIAPAYLVLIWPFTFMTYYFLGITAFGIVRISKKTYVNNIVSIFVLTFFGSIFRAPFNTLYISTILLPVYLFYFAFRSLRDEKYLWIYYVCFMAGSACTSAILYTSAAFFATFFISSYFKKNYDKLTTIFKLAIPTYCLGLLYLLESNRTIFSFGIAFLFLAIIWYLLRFKLIKRFARDVAIFMFVLIPTLFIVAPKDDRIIKFADAFMNQGSVADKQATTAQNACIVSNIELEDYKYEVDYTVFGTSMNYIYKSPKTLLNTSMIMITHSLLLYGGLLFYLIYGFFKKRHKHFYKMFLLYILFFFNPFVSEGLSMLTLDLNDRIYLFFNTFYAIYGIVWFFEWLEELDIKFINVLIKYAYIPYAFLLVLSVYSYVSLVKTPYSNNIDPLYKVPENLVDSNVEVNKLVSTPLGEDKKPVVLYTLDTLSLTMIDENPNNKYKLIDSKDYKTFYFDTSYVSNKMLLNLYFLSNGKYDFEYLKLYIKNGDYNEGYCDIAKLLKEYNVSYIVVGSDYRNSYDRIKNDYEIVYDKNDILVLKRSV